MTARLALPVLAAALALTSGCSSLRESGLNPTNWFGGARMAPAAMPRENLPDLVPARGGVRVVDRRELVAEVLSVSAGAVNGGLMVQATGIAPTQGFYNAELVRVPSQTQGLLRLAFRAQRPAGAAAIGSPRSRRIAVATVLSPEALAGIRRIRVEAAGSAREIRR